LGVRYSELAVRDIEERDYPLICHMAQNQQDLFYSFPMADFPLMEEALKKELQNRIDPLVVVYQGKTVAYADFYRCQRGKKCSIGHVIVDPSVRGLGIGGYLLKVMANRAFEAYSVAEVHVACYSENTAALVLYTQLGFLPFSMEERRDKDGRRVVLLHLKTNEVY